MVERYPVNDFAQFCLGRALSLSGEPSAPATTWRSPRTCGPSAATTGLPRRACAPLLGSMRALVQRVSRRLGPVDGDGSPRSGPGCWSCSGSATATTSREADRIADKVRRCGSSTDADGRMNEPLGEREILCVSQFTLYGDTRKGNRPSFIGAAPPEVAEPLYERVCERLGAERGRVRRRMAVELVNDGPVTLLLEA